MQQHARWGIDLAPHGKTTMSPQLFTRQLVAGAWASPSPPSPTEIGMAAACAAR
jgi:D-serine dehydratase